eukprot:TRINITY_DN106723_c0_g1_i1.p1 TRINITY_DN106723_c0_g1~~TRINITY_DN106723_c0_g1_i1.p1  ORF type:complete len:203 (-),score=28.56 TRINITY_DN106723_c0_g1_i1:41-559(-)
MPMRPTATTPQRKRFPSAPPPPPGVGIPLEPNTSSSPYRERRSSSSQHVNMHNHHLHSSSSININNPQQQQHTSHLNTTMSSDETSGTENSYSEDSSSDGGGRSPHSPFMRGGPHYGPSPTISLQHSAEWDEEEYSPHGSPRVPHEVHTTTYTVRHRSVSPPRGRHRGNELW